MKIIFCAMLYILYVPAAEAGIEDKITGLIKVVKEDKEYRVYFTEEGETAVRELCREVIKEEHVAPPHSIETTRKRNYPDRYFLDHLIAF